MFKKGESGNPKGRPEGSKNKNCMNPVFWYNLIQEKSVAMTDKEVIEVAFRALNLLMPKVNNLPATPDDSVENTKVLLDQLEKRSIPPPAAQPLDSSGHNGNGNGNAH